MQTLITVHEDTFYKFFKPFRHPKAKFDIWGGHGLETFGSDYELVKGFDESCIWTVVEGCASDEECITSGRHLINRVCYLITKISHKNLHIDIACKNPYTPLAKVESMAQISLLKQALAE